jgi:hypothetical protein
MSGELRREIAYVIAGHDIISRLGLSDDEALPIADAVMAALPPALTAAQREDIEIVSAAALSWIVTFPDPHGAVASAVSRLRALAARQAS